MKGSVGLIFIISGPSGSGKTTLVNRLLKNRNIKGKLVRSVSLTTRPKRTGERDRGDYFFITQKEFLRRKKAKKILEWTKYIGYYYATPKDYVEAQLKKGKSIVLCLDTKGALALKRLYPKNAVTVFVRVPALDELKRRITQRCNKTKKAELKKRLAVARREMRQAARYDYQVVNEDLSEATEALKNIIIKSIGN